MKAPESSLYLFENIGRLSSPDNRFRIIVVGVNVLLDSAGAHGRGQHAVWSYGQRGFLFFHAPTIARMEGNRGRNMPEEDIFKNREN